MRHAFRLRTQLILSHLVAIACTLVAMVAAVVLIVGSWYTSQQGSLSEPTQNARDVSNAIGGLVTDGHSPADLNSVLRVLASGDLSVLPPSATFGPRWWQRGSESGTALHDVAYIVVVDPTGQPVASSDPTGAAFAPAERDEWNRLAQAALTTPSDPAELVSVRPNSQPAAFGAYPILNANGRPVSVVVVAS